MGIYGNIRCPIINCNTALSLFHTSNMSQEIVLYLGYLTCVEIETERLAQSLRKELRLESANYLKD